MTDKAMLERAQALKGELVRLRRTIHQNPELGFDLYETAGLVARTLADLGIEAQTGVGKTGVVAHLGRGDGPALGIRADMDALPILEQTGVAYASKIPGKMHACGHDAHTAMLLGAAMLLKEADVPGEVRLIFQPSEESFDDDGVSGAPCMLADGALDGLDAVIALHVDTKLEVGKIRVAPGVAQAAVDDFRIYVQGRGGHAAHPYSGLDPIWLMTQVLQSLYAIPSRRLNPLNSGIVTVGIVRAGSASNIIPAEAYIEGTLRSHDEKVRLQLREDVEKAAAMVRAWSGDYRLELDFGYPPLVNDPTVAGWLQQVGSDMLGPEAVTDAEMVSFGAEDFAYMTAKVPGAMFRLGVKPAEGAFGGLHEATFNLDEEALPFGAAMFAETALRFLRGELKL
ncbi:MAG TPA: M20 family metallopeptidase [Anaerolineae bacterium]|nr:M20 family metallopeptidase [Anaerolineae bacterium]